MMRMPNCCLPALVRVATPTSWHASSPPSRECHLPRHFGPSQFCQGPTCCHLFHGEDVAPFASPLVGRHPSHSTEDLAVWLGITVCGEAQEALPSGSSAASESLQNRLGHGERLQRHWIPGVQPAVPARCSSFSWLQAQRHHHVARVREGGALPLHPRQESAGPRHVFGSMLDRIGSEHLAHLSMF